MKMFPNEKHGSPQFSVNTRPITPESLEQNYLPARIKEIKPQPLSRWQRFVSSARSFFRMKPSAVQTNYNKAMNTYKDELAKFRLNTGKPTIEDRGRMGIGIHGKTPAEAKPKNITQENLKKEMHVVDRFLRPQNLGYFVPSDLGRAICNDAKAFTPDWNPGTLSDNRLSQDWDAYRSFATTIHNAAQKDSAIRNLVCSMGAIRKDCHLPTPNSGLFRLYSTYCTQYNNGKVMDVEGMLSDAVHGRTSDRKTHDLSNLLLDGRTPASRIKESTLNNPVKAPEPLQMKH